MKRRDEKLLAEYRGAGKCEWCKKMVCNREPHHYWVSRGFGGATRLDHPYNLVALCATFSGGDDCHHRAHLGLIQRCDILAIVAAREGKLQGEIQDELERLKWNRRA